MFLEEWRRRELGWLTDLVLTWARIWSWYGKSISTISVFQGWSLNAEISDLAAANKISNCVSRGSSANISIVHNQSDTLIRIWGINVSPIHCLFIIASNIINHFSIVRLNLTKHTIISQWITRTKRMSHARTHTKNIIKLLVLIKSHPFRLIHWAKTVIPNSTCLISSDSIVHIKSRHNSANNLL